MSFCSVQDNGLVYCTTSYKQVNWVLGILQRHKKSSCQVFSSGAWFTCSPPQQHLLAFLKCCPDSPQNHLFSKPPLFKTTLGDFKWCDKTTERDIRNHTVSTQLGVFKKTWKSVCMYTVSLETMSPFLISQNFIWSSAFPETNKWE